MGAYCEFVAATTRYSGELRAVLALILHRNRQAQGPYPIDLSSSDYRSRIGQPSLCGIRIGSEGFLAYMRHSHW